MAIPVPIRRMTRCVWQLQQDGCNQDPPQSPRRQLHHHLPRWDSNGLRTPDPRCLGCRVRRARAAPLRVGAARGPPTAPSDRADAGMGARRDHDVAGPRGGWACHGCGKSVEWSRAARRLCCRPGGGGGACRGPRAWCGGLRHQGRACGGRSRCGGARWPARVCVAARTAARGDSRACAGRPAVQKRHLLVGVRLLTGRQRTPARPTTRITLTRPSRRTRDTLEVRSLCAGRSASCKLLYTCYIVII